MDLDIVTCWCVPENVVILMKGPNCTWPECVNKDMPDPALMNKE